ncbi:ISPs1a-2 [Pseudomonas syringae pv. daphniphylli]|uniref:ISPs1a-2 n=1 Tax=Pseudomonas syringae pv. daphniphylli TaxID=264455 RepID=A0A9X0H3E5_PSESX|nr:ISPs1a-2 [Pseudomonas syringae pv. daphniphylli]
MQENVPLQAPGKRGPEEPLDNTLRCSRSGLTAKIHMVCDANGVPLRFMLSPGQASDIAHAQPLLDQVRIPGKPGRPRKRSRWLLADKGYDAEHLRYDCDRIPNTACDPATHHATQTPVWLAPTFLSSKVSAAQHH